MSVLGVICDMYAYVFVLMCMQDTHVPLQTCVQGSVCVCVWWGVVSFLILASLSFETLLWFPPLKGVHKPFSVLGPGRYRQEQAEFGFLGFSG